MKRGTPLKRRAMKRTRRKPTPVLDAYRDSCGLDEIAFELGVLLLDNCGFTPQWVGHKVAATETNHIWSVGRRPDLRSNLIRLSAPAHRYFHRELNSGRVLCMLAKARKATRTGDPREFDIAELDAAAGRSVRGWAESSKLPVWIEPYLVELLSRLDAAALELERGEKS